MMASSSSDNNDPLILPEIVGQVLIHLTQRDLANVILVNKTWGEIACEYISRHPSTLKPKTISLSSARVGQFFRAAAIFCTAMKRLLLTITFTAHASFRKDFMALGRLTSLVDLDLHAERLPSATPPLEPGDIIRTVCRLSRLTHLALNIYGIFFLPEHLSAVGAALLSLEWLSGPFALDVEAFATLQAGRSIPRGRFISPKKGCKTYPFSKLKSLQVRRALLPQSGSLETDVRAPSVRTIPEWDRYLIKLVRIATRVVLDEKPELKHYSVSNVSTPEEDNADYYVDFDVLDSWNSFLENTMNTAIHKWETGVAPKIKQAKVQVLVQRGRQQ